MNSTPPFRYCFNTSTIRGQKLPLPETVTLIAQAGYDGFEPWIDEIDRFVAEGGSLADLRARIADAGLTVEGAIGFFAWCVDAPFARVEALAEARRNCELLQAIGGKRLAAPPWGAIETADLALDDLAERYAALCRLGDEYDVVMQAEIWGFSQTLTTLAEAAYVTLASQHPRACILADVYHLYKGGSGYDGLRLLSGDALGVFHVNDVPPHIEPEQIGDKDRVLPGEGVAPLSDVFRTLQTIGFHGPLSLELFREDLYKLPPADVCRRGLQAMRQAVETALVPPADPITPPRDTWPRLSDREVG